MGLSTEHTAQGKGVNREQPECPAVCGFRDVMQGWGSAFLSEHGTSAFRCPVGLGALWTAGECRGGRGSRCQELHPSLPVSFESQALESEIQGEGVAARLPRLPVPPG